MFSIDNEVSVDVVISYKLIPFTAVSVLYLKVSI